MILDSCAEDILGHRSLIFHESVQLIVKVDEVFISISNATAPLLPLLGTF